jgi:oligopeptidase B
MRILMAALVIMSVVAILGCKAKPAAEPPVAKVVPVELEQHGDVRTDNYYWMNQREDPEVVSYLEAENGYTDAMMAHTGDLQEKLFEEIKGRIKQTDMSVPYKKDDYFYFTRYEDGKEYPIYGRKKGSLEADEEIMLEVNEMAEGHDYYAVGRRAISSGEDLLAYSVDTVGRRFYTIRVKNLTTGEMLDDAIPDVTGNMAWANDNNTLFYSKQDPTTLRSYQIYKHVLGSDPSGDELVYEEKDDTYSCYIFKTKSKRYIMIISVQTLSTEFRYLDADNPDGSFKVFEPRKRDHEYFVDHYGKHFFIRTNDEAKNYRMMKTPISKTAMKHWQEVIPHRDDVLLEGMEIFNDHLVLVERSEGLIQMRVRPWSGEGEHYLDFGEPAYLAYVGPNFDFDSPLLRFIYMSMTTPRSVFDYDMVTREKTLLKEEEILGGFDRESYTTERLWATAQDGAKVPISLVYRNDARKEGGNPTVVYGYGSYGHSMDAAFDPDRLSLLDRGFVYAIAHIRGGEELGRQWYEDGKLFKKMNTFTDFIACAEHLAKEGYADPDNIFAVGGSAGGLLVGAVMNMRPELFNGIVAAVPFVDVVTTMLDDSIPLTTSEYDEWGNPNEKDYYDYMLSYSPYDQVEAKNYPNLLVTTSLHDSQVQYWEPAKWIAKLRVMKTDDNRILLKTEMQAGHGGVSGRYKRYEKTAFRYAFVLDLAGINK